MTPPPIGLFRAKKLYDERNNANEHNMVKNPNWRKADQVAIYNYIITQVILAFWLVLAYDLLEDRCMIDVIITKVFPLRF